MLQRAGGPAAGDGEASATGTAGMAAGDVEEEAKAVGARGAAAAKNVPQERRAGVTVSLAAAAAAKVWVGTAAGVPAVTAGAAVGAGVREGWEEAAGAMAG